jgi:hypothetical protein
MAQCKATRADGRPCQGKPLPGESYCFAHSERLQRTRAEGQARGGRNKSKVARVQRALDDKLSTIANQLLLALLQTHRGDIRPAVGTSMAALASAYLKVMEVAELQVKIEDLEARLGGDERRWGT